MPVEHPGLDPFGQFGRAFERLVRQVGDLGLGEPFGERIDRFDQVPINPALSSATWSGWTICSIWSYWSSLPATHRFSPTGNSFFAVYEALPK